jgi:CO/xanthine dehydrogenase Mo-binding subunit
MSRANDTPEDVAARRNKSPAGTSSAEGFDVIGQSMDRPEDRRLLTGNGTFIDDIHLPAMAHAAIVRSPHAHARIRDIDTNAAEEMDGVLLVMTGEEAAEETGPLPCFSSPPVEQYCIAPERVRHVGEAVAAVVAEDRYIAEDAAELVEVEYEELPVASDPRDAENATDDEVLHPDRNDGCPGNVGLRNHLKFGTPDEDFEEADHVVSRSLRWARAGGQPMETAGAVAEYEAGSGTFTIHANTSMYNYVGWLVADSLNVAANQVTIDPVVAGGSFGSKLFVHKVCVLSATLARACGRPVKYIEDRVENITNCDNHGCNRYYDIDLALKDDGTMTALRTEVTDDYGAYFQFEVGHHGNSMAQVVGPYGIESVDYDLTAALTNKCQQGAYRGFGSEVSNFVLERVVDAAAEELDMDPVELRRQNFIEPDQFPYKIPGGNVYDSGDYQAVLEKALEMSDYEEWRREQDAEDDRRIGIGLVSANERSVFSATEFWFWNDEPDFPLTSSPESASIKMDATGTVNVTLHSPFWGNSPETVATQIVAEELTVDPEDVSVSYSDTDSGLEGTGPGGSRYTVMVAGALEGAAEELKGKMFQIAGSMLEAEAGDLELTEGDIRVQGAPDRAVSIPEIAMQAHAFRLDLPEDIDSGLAADHTYDHPYTTMPDDDRDDLGVFYPIVGNMCHVAVVEVDPETGKVDFLDYTAIHDAGTVVNPKTIAGQVRGGTVQGIASAMYEDFNYDDGDLLADNYHDYLIPSLHDVPQEIKVGHVETPSPFTEYGIKGAGEGGRMAAPAVVTQAIEDALRQADIEVDIDELPVTPDRLHGLIEAAGERTASADD